MGSGVDFAVRNNTFPPYDIQRLMYASGRTKHASILVMTPSGLGCRCRRARVGRAISQQVKRK